MGGRRLLDRELMVARARKEFALDQLVPREKEANRLALSCSGSALILKSPAHHIGKQAPRVPAMIVGGAIEHPEVRKQVRPVPATHLCCLNQAST
ncbi:hypothetical protein GCM10007857_63990 [Bradyrhizobium iriomotense]|uniref:Uncharacterized protein n=1 Tax=Bradyrhizobium iriomotense TaxID=441950 RepID=A0ABQ6B7P4_9BRAD|nr:hypothetical protein GCM10007857_63990 [Bradyrhizobium iriomotense]